MSSSPLTPDRKERPIIFSGPMVRAILDGKKTQTRRVVKPQPGAGEHIGHSEARGWRVWADVGTCPADHDQIYFDLRCPYGVPGDRLWVRETWRIVTWGICNHSEGDVHVGYEAGGDPLDVRGLPRDQQGRIAASHAHPDRWRPSIHMPRWASRLTLEAVSVRVELLWRISDEDVRAEGFVSRDDMRETWVKINGIGSWAASPWVWAIEFRRLP